MHRLKLDMMKEHFTVKQWYKLPRMVVDAPALETFKVTLDMLWAISSSWKMSLLIVGWLDQGTFKSFLLTKSILWFCDLKALNAHAL